MPAKTKARDIVPGWPRSRSTMIMWPHDWTDGWRFSRSIYNSAGCAGDAFRRTTEEALEAEYRAGQNAMVDNHRAMYRRLTHEDLQWLRAVAGDPLREAMKMNFYGQYLESLSKGYEIPLELALTIKNCAKNDESFWHRFRIASVCTENG